MWPHLENLEEFQWNIINAHQKKLNWIDHKRYDEYPELVSFENRIQEIFEYHSDIHNIVLLRCPNMSKYDERTVRRLKHQYPGFVIRKLDKNMGTVVINFGMWNRSVDKALNEADFFVKIECNQK
eukprot:738156_1